MYMFLQVNTSSSKKTIEEIIERIDLILMEYKCATYYENPSYHMSVAWMLGDIEQSVHLQTIRQAFAKTFNDVEIQDRSLLSFVVDKVIFKCATSLII